MTFADAVGYGESMGMRVDVVTEGTAQEWKIGIEESFATPHHRFRRVGVPY